VSHNANLHSLTVNGAQRVTDLGLGGAVMNSPDLRTLSVAGTSPKLTYGHFIPKVLELRNLQHLELKGVLLDLQDLEAHSRYVCRAALFAATQRMTHARANGNV
jgi:hypothetical protein